METAFLRWLGGRLPGDPRLAIGPGDDAAVLRPLHGRIVAAVDLLTEGIDFHLDTVQPRRVGHKALAVNLSDLAAMAARPLAALVALALPRGGALHLAQELIEGMLPLAAEHQVAIAGGDTNTWDGGLVISVTILGETTGRGPLSRRGARPGDRIVVTGSFGGSLLGRHLDVQPRVAQALQLHQHYLLHAGIDVSDGLAKDLGRLAEASGCGAEVQLTAVPVSPDAHRLAESAADGTTPLEHALHDGEDFELVLAVPEEEARRMLAEQPLDVPLTDIGRFVPDGLWQIDDTGRRTALEPRGWEH